MIVNIGIHTHSNLTEAELCIRNGEVTKALKRIKYVKALLLEKKADLSGEIEVDELDAIWTKTNGEFEKPTTKQKKFLTLDECQSEVAMKNRLGRTLVTGHRVGYFNEAAEMYAAQYKV